MSSYMDSEFIQNEVQEMQFLQSLVTSMSEEAENTDNIDFLIEYYHTLYALLDKQHVIYTRLTLTDDEEATRMAQSLCDEADKIGKDPSISMSCFYSNTKKEIEDQLQLLDDFSI